MLNKEIVKEYLVRECPKIAYVMSKKEYAFSLLKKIIENQIWQSDDLDASDEDDPDVDSLLDFIKLNPEAYELLQQRLKSQDKDAAQLLIDEMMNFQEVSELSRRYFSLLYPNQCARADTHDFSLDGHEIRNLDIVEQQTQALLDNPQVRVIFEGQVRCDGLIARWDVLIKEEHGYRLYEVKGTNNVYTRTKEKDKIVPNRIKKPFIYDLAFQYEVYQRAKLPILETNFLFLNKEFVSQKKFLSYPLDDADCRLIFLEAKEVFNHHKKDKRLIPIKEYIDEFWYVGKEEYPVSYYIEKLKAIAKLPDLPPTKLLYACRKAGGCLLLSECYPQLNQDPNHIFRLTCNNRIGGSYHACARLIADGTEYIDAISEDVMEADYPSQKNDKRSLAHLQILYAKQKLHHPLIDRVGLQTLLEHEYQQYPLIFFDFETFSYPIPLVDKCRPWEKVCCQYSMHIVAKDYQLLAHDFKQGTGGGIQHYEFIGNPKEDGLTNPEVHLITQLKAQLQAANIDVENGKFTLVVYNKTFEKGELSRMALKYPDHSVFLTRLNARVVDLLDFFIQGYWYQSSFHGKVSLKVTQPEIMKSEFAQIVYGKYLQRILKTLDYQQGLIQNGAVALDVYQSLLRKVLLHQDVEDIHQPMLNALLAYCKIDSWGTVVLYDLIRNIALDKGE